MQCEWLEGFTVEYLVDAVRNMKAELLRRGLDEKGEAITIMRVPDGLRASYLTASERARARRMVDDSLAMAPIPRRPHHDCECPRDLAFHRQGCRVAEVIRDAARRDPELDNDLDEVLGQRDNVVTIRVQGRVEVES